MLYQKYGTSLKMEFNYFHNLLKKNLDVNYFCVIITSRQRLRMKP